ncbi:phospholipase D-like domain-containing protein [Cryptosporangium sp. NPDC048952]|uniref:phospholipase D-like domain-containing protein n=1 Tax=Cryptosporangium sp. NPDC048952 TaxID=3363961 RepID=UPI00371F934C
MRAQAKADGLTVRAVAGNNVVLLGFDLPAPSTAGLLGFGIERTDHTEGERYWLRNDLAFRNSRGRTTDVSPVQTFRWGDYTAKPDHHYTYRVVAWVGTPGKLIPLAEAAVEIRTEGYLTGNHSVYFNRGIAASQQYAARFGNKAPADIPRREAYTWLSRGLEEALLAFIGQAADASWELQGALYEFRHQPVLDALRIAADAGARVRLVVDASTKDDSPRETNLAAIADAGLGPNVIPREHSSAIAHNKFLVALRNGTPVAVWTGSTNITEGGIFGHSNVGHAVHDPDVAAAFSAYWQELAADPTSAVLRKWVGANPPVPSGPATSGTLFSPRSGSAAMLDWYGSLVRGAQRSVFLTAAFGVAERLRPVFVEERDILRYVLLDNNRGRIDLMIRDADPDNQVSVGAALPAGRFGQWLGESTLDLNQHVNFIHTKILLIDPLGDDPVVLTGSANFSPASVSSNDENMLVIAGDTAVADIYLTEYMRLFTHYEFRYAVTARPVAAPGQAITPRRSLTPDDSWVPRWYEPGSARAKERALFSGN